MSALLTLVKKFKKENIILKLCILSTFYKLKKSHFLFKFCLFFLFVIL